MASRSDITKAAKEELKQGVKGRPNKYTNWYGSNDNWCAMFVSYVCDKAGVPTSVVPKTAAVQTLYDFAKNNRRFKAKDSGYKPKGGDIMIQKSNGASHTGIVISSSGSSFKTIEGNSGNAVRECSYTLSSSALTGFFVPDYSEKGSGFSDDTDSTANENVPLCSTSVVSTVNVGEAVRSGSHYVNIKGLGLKYELHIINNGVDYVPIVLDTVEWTTEWCDTPGELNFTVLKDSNINITEGNVVIFKMDKYNIFYGYLFKKSKGKDGEINCTAYDQLRYFKNEDTFCYKNKTYTEVLQYIAAEYNLTYSSTITDTKYKIPAAVEDNVSLFEMLKNARKETAYNTGMLYILFDDFGSLTIRGVEELRTNYLLTEQGFEDFEYETSIDDGVYNRVQLYKDDDDTGNRAKYIYEDGTNINKWGILQQTVELGEDDAPEMWGKQILALNNQKKVTLSVKGCFGDPNLRAGASLFVSLNVGDVVYDRACFFITKAIHSFGKSYTCDLELAGQKDFVGDV